MQNKCKNKLTAVLLTMVCIAALVITGCSNTTATDTTAAETNSKASSAAAQQSTSAASTSAEEQSESAVEEILKQVEAQMNTAIGSEPETGKNEKIGVLISATSNEFWATMKADYEAAAEELGITIEVQEAETEDDADGQLDKLNTMATMDYDAIIVSPINGTNLISGIVACNEANIPVINLGPGVDTDALADAGGHLDAKITVNFEEQGQTVAKDMIARMPDGGEVAILQGLDGASQSTGRTAGATSVFEETEGITLVTSQVCDWDAAKAYDATKDILTAHPDVKGIFACNDTMALAAVQALTEMDIQDVMVYGVDYTSDAKAAIQEKTMMGSMTYSSVVYTKAALKMGMILAQDGSFDEPIYLPLTLVTQDNVGDFEGWK